MRMLAVDMDDTSLNSKNRISQRTLDALKAAADAGIEVVPTTVRALSCLPHQLRGADFIRYVITSNGAEVTDLKTGKSIFNSLIPGELVCDLLARKKGIKAVVTAHMGNKVVVQGLFPTFLGKCSYGKDTAKGVVYTHNLTRYIQKTGMDVESMQFMVLSPHAGPKTIAMLSQFPQLQTNLTRKYAECYLKESTKGTGLTALANHLGISKDEIACVGDSHFDLHMFAASGLKFAMGNAEQVLKDAADHVMPTNDEDGVAVAIEKYLLK